MDESSKPSPKGLTLPGETAKQLAPALAALSLLDQDANITRVARKLGVSQSTLSRSLARWETVLSTHLTVASGRRVELTPAGRELARAATQSLAVLADAIRTIDREAEKNDSLSIGSLRSVSTTIVAELLAPLLGADSHTALTQRESSTEELLQAIRDRELDVAVLSPRPSVEFGWLTIGIQSLALVVDPTHRLAGRSSVDLREAAGERFIALSPRFATRTLADELTQEAGFLPTPVVEADDLRVLHELIAQGRGIAILPNDGMPNPRLRSIAIDSPGSAREIGLAWWGRRPSSRAAALLVDHARELNRHYPEWADLNLRAHRQSTAFPPGTGRLARCSSTLNRGSLG